MNLVPVTNACRPIPLNFTQLIEEHLSGKRKSIPIQTILQESFMVAVERGLNEDEFSLLLRYFSKGSISVTNKKKLLPNVAPSTTAPADTMKSFMVWFISNYKKINVSLTVYILQWIIGLLDNDLVDPRIIDIFYYDFYMMLHKKELVKYACKLLYKLTKPLDVTSNVVSIVTHKQQKFIGDVDEKYLFAVLNLFKGYKPHLVSEGIKKVDANKLFTTIPQKMDFLLKLINRRYKQLHTTDLGIFETPGVSSVYLQSGKSKMSSLIPFPSYSAEGIDKIIVCYPNSIEETFRKIKRVPIPQNIISLLRDETGFFLIMHHGIDMQKRLSVTLMRTLQNVLIDQVEEAHEDDKEFLLSRIYQLQMFMQQGLSCVSIFLAGYLLNWDGLDYRSDILGLIEWVTFNSYEELSANILRPLYMLFVSSNGNMKKQIIQTGTNLIRNMYTTDLCRVRQGIPYPFLKQGPAWTADPISMLEPFIKWMENLIKIGLCVEPGNNILLMECIHFYEMMNVLESNSNLPIWTIISRGVVYRSLCNISPIALSRVCKLLLRYHKQFLPQLRMNQQHFYEECSGKINLTSKYAQELINMLWNGQAQTRKEDGLIFKQIPDEALEPWINDVNLDNVFDLQHNINFLPYIILEREKNGLFLKSKADFLALAEFHVECIAEFIKHFSPTFQSP